MNDKPARMDQLWPLVLGYFPLALLGTVALVVAAITRARRPARRWPPVLALGGAICAALGVVHPRLADPRTGVRGAASPS